MGSTAGLAAIEALIDASGAAGQIEVLLPAGVRHRQLPARTLLTGMMLALDDRRPAYLTEARAALTCLPGPELARRMTAGSCDHDPVRALAAVLLDMARAGIGPGDVTGDSGYAHRDAGA